MVTKSSDVIGAEGFAQTVSLIDFNHCLLPSYHSLIQFIFLFISLPDCQPACGKV